MEGLIPRLQRFRGVSNPVTWGVALGYCIARLRRLHLFMGFAEDFAGFLIVWLIGWLILLTFRVAWKVFCVTQKAFSTVLNLSKRRRKVSAPLCSPSVSFRRRSA
jgi:hypothetical protein